MRIAVSVDDQRGLDATVHPHFGRCPYFVLADVEGSEVRAYRTVANPFYGHHEPGQVPGFVRSHGAEVMLTGGMGGRAVAFFRECGIEPVTGATGTVAHALAQYLTGALRGVAPCSESVEHGHGQVEAAGEQEQGEAGRLREEAEALQRQIDDVRARLKRLRSG